jgi:hypothetical protein
MNRSTSATSASTSATMILPTPLPKTRFGSSRGIFGRGFVQEMWKAGMLGYFGITFAAKSSTLASKCSR